MPLDIHPHTNPLVAEGYRLAHIQVTYKLHFADMAAGLAHIVCNELDWEEDGAPDDLTKDEAEDKIRALVMELGGELGGWEDDIDSDEEGRKLVDEIQKWATETAHAFWGQEFGLTAPT